MEGCAPACDCLQFIDVDVSKYALQVMVVVNSIFRHGNYLKTQISMAVKLTFHGEKLLSAGKRNWQYKKKRKKEALIRFQSCCVFFSFFFQISSHASILVRSRTLCISGYFVFHASRGSQCRCIRIRTFVRKSEKERTVCFSLFFPHHW